MTSKTHQIVALAHNADQRSTAERVNGLVAAHNRNGQMQVLELCTDIDDKLGKYRPAVVLALGRWAVGDKGFGMFAWIEGSTLPVYAGICHSPAEGMPGRYVRLFIGPVHFLWCAHGNGVDDADGNVTGDDDTDIINDLLTWGSDNGYNNFVVDELPDHHYYIMTAPLKYHSRQHIRGSDLYLSHMFFQDCDGVQPADTSESPDSIIVDNFRLSGNAATSTANSLTITDITQNANGAVITCTGTATIAASDIVYIRGVVGMTEINRTSGVVQSLTTDADGNPTSITTDIDSSAYTAYTSGGTVTRQTCGMFINQTTDVVLGGQIENFCIGIRCDVALSNAPHRIHIQAAAKITQNADPNYLNGYPAKGILYSGTGGRGQSQANTGIGIFAQARTQGFEEKDSGDGVKTKFYFDWSVRNRGLHKDSGVQFQTIDGTTGAVTQAVNGTDGTLYAVDLTTGTETVIPPGTVEISTYDGAAVAGFVPYKVKKVAFDFNTPPAAGTKNIIKHWGDPTGRVGVDFNDGTGNDIHFQTIGGYEDSIRINDTNNNVLVSHNINSERFVDMVPTTADESHAELIHAQYGTMQLATIFDSPLPERATVFKGVNRIGLTVIGTNSQNVTNNTYKAYQWDSTIDGATQAYVATGKDRSGANVSRSTVYLDIHYQLTRHIVVPFKWDVNSTNTDSRGWVALDRSFDNWVTYDTLEEIEVGQAVSAGTVHAYGHSTIEAWDRTLKKRTGNHTTRAYYRLSYKCNDAANATMTVTGAKIRLNEVHQT